MTDDARRTSPLGDEPDRPDRVTSNGTMLPTHIGEGRYAVGEVLGSGGMGMVVAAHDEVLDREVAIKLLADNLALDEESRRRFHEEARAAGGLHHPNIVQVLDVGEHDGRPFLVMERSGPSLAESAPLDPDAVVAVARDLLSGLGRAHGAGVLHRDLKPANLLVASDGRVQVTDFGVARAADRPELTRTGLVLGTRAYIAPERLHGAEATRRTDLYSVGATLLELLTGERVAETQDGVDRSTLPPGTPSGLVALLDRCLARDPQRRPGSVAAARDLLDGTSATQVLPAMEAATETVAIAREEPEATAATGGDDGVREEPGAAAGDDEDGAGQPAGRRLPAWAVPVGVVVVALSLLAITSDAGQDPTGDEPVAEADADPTAGTGEDGGADAGAEVPPLDTEASEPAGIARDTAAWLRDLGG
jgi:eukaryotic-like serine/threonine-protein kinase